MLKIPLSPKMRFCCVQALGLTSLFLATVAQGTLPGPPGEAPVTVIDLHAHVFNAHDLPLAGLLNALGAPLGVNVALAKVINAATVDDLDGPMPNVVSPLTLTSEGMGEEFLKNAQSRSGDPDLSSLFAVLRPEERDQLFEFVGESSDPELEKLNALKGVELEVEVLTRAMAKIGFPPEEHGEKKSDELSLKANLPGYLSFLGVMMNGNVRIARQLESTEYPAVDLFIHHMMDMEKAYAAKPVVPFSQQVTRMAKLDRRFGGKFLHFTAYDPFRGEDALPSVIRGLKAGAVGVKFYPPSGYSAVNNQLPPKPSRFKPGSRKRWFSRYENLDAAQLDSLNEKLFAYCETHSIPIFTHCTPSGFEADDGYGGMANPKYWAVVLKKHKKLRLCFGHAGGHSYWFPAATPNVVEKAEADFGEQVVNLCLEYPHVYCEVAYLDQILSEAGKTAFKAKLASVIDKPSKDGTWKFGNKLMYGSDWHMIHKEPRHKEYPQAFNGLFTDAPLKRWQRAFFARNALDYLEFKKVIEKPWVTKDQKKYWQQLMTDSAAGPASGTE